MGASFKKFRRTLEGWLQETGLPYTIEAGGSHWKVWLGGKMVTVLSHSSVDAGARNIKNLRASIRRAARQQKLLEIASEVRAGEDRGVEGDDRFALGVPPHVVGGEASAYAIARSTGPDREEDRDAIIADVSEQPVPVETGGGEVAHDRSLSGADGHIGEAGMSKEALRFKVSSTERTLTITRNRNRDGVKYDISLIDNWLVLTKLDSADNRRAKGTVFALAGKEEKRGAVRSYMTKHITDDLAKLPLFGRTVVPYKLEGEDIWLDLTPALKNSRMRTGEYEVVKRAVKQEVPPAVEPATDWPTAIRQAEAKAPVSAPDNAGVRYDPETGHLVLIVQRAGVWRDATSADMEERGIYIRATR